ncbi:MAG: hypothetical protein ACRC62_15420 [Microcoleus sp.]
MSFINLTPHSVEVYAEIAFINLEQVNPTTWVADSIEGTAIMSIESSGSARISTSTVEAGVVDNVPMVATQYGEAMGIPADVAPGDLLIVSLPMQSMMKASNHALAGQAVAPYKVVRLRSNTSTVLGCMGFTY